MNLYSQLLKCSETDCNNKTITALVIVIKKTRSEQAQQQTKFRLFFTLSKLFIKAINNFNHLTRNVPKHKLLHTPEDIALECYLTYDTCLKNMKLEHVKKFYFFLNTALNRAIFRLYEKQYQRYFNAIENKEENVHLLENAGYSQHIDFTEVDLLDFTAEELEVLKFKVQGGKLSVFLKEHDMAGAIFYKTFEAIKQKLLMRYKDEIYFQDFELAAQ